MTELGRVVVVALVVLTGLTRVVWFSDFFRRCWRASASGPQPLRQSWEKARRTTNELQGGVPDRHQGLLQVEARRLETMLIGGSVALAAWTQLFVSGEVEPASRLSALSVGLLF